MNPNGSNPLRIGAYPRFLGLCGLALALSCLANAHAPAAPFTTYGFSGTHGVFAVSCSGLADTLLPDLTGGDQRGHFQPDRTAPPIR